MKVLVVEDEAGISRTLDAYLRRDGYATEVAATGKQALTLFRAAQPDLVLLDVMLPELDGFEVLKTIRRESDVPVIMLTARSEEVDRLVGLGLGADDYVVKPFSFREVMARVKAVLRRALPTPDRGARPLTVGRLEVDVDAVSASFAGEELQLTATEFRLLAALATAPGRVFSRTELIEKALPDSDILERTHFYLVELARAMAASAQVQANRKGVTVVAKDVEPVVVDADRDRIRQVMLNLLDNAIRYSPRGGHVTIDVQLGASGPSFSVSDEGPGVPAGSEESIFERFARADVSRGRAGGGSGLGLAIVRSIVELHGGSVTAANASGGGAVFTVRL